MKTTWQPHEIFQLHESKNDMKYLYCDNDRISERAA